jgi:uncharacterized OsmC-like protein
LSIDIRERQRPLKERYKEEPESAILRNSVRSEFIPDDPLRSRIRVGEHTYEVATHAMAGGLDGEVCSGDVLLAALAACQEITIKMVAASMGIVLDDLKITVTGEMDFRGTMGVDRAVPVGYQRIVCEIAVSAQADPERMRRLIERGEQYCVVRETLTHGVPVESRIEVSGLTPA